MARTRIAALLALLALALLAGCGGDDGDGESSQDARALLEKAFSKQVDSADLKLEVKADLEGLDQLRGPVSLTMSGPFESRGENELPLLDWDVKAKFANQTIDAGLTVTEDNAYVELRGQAYEVGEQLFSQLERNFERRRRTGDQKQSLKQFGIDPVKWLDDPKVEDGDDIGGDSTQRVSGDVDVKQVVEDVLGALRSPEVRRQLEQQGQTVPQVPEVSQDDVDKVSDAIKELRFEVDVDEDDVAEAAVRRGRVRRARGHRRRPADRRQGLGRVRARGGGRRPRHQGAGEPAADHRAAGPVRPGRRAGPASAAVRTSKGGTHAPLCNPPNGGFAA